MGKAKFKMDLGIKSEMINLKVNIINILYVKSSHFCQSGNHHLIFQRHVQTTKTLSYSVICNKEKASLVTLYIPKYNFSIMENYIYVEHK